jgi:hypothetical protein
MGSLRGKLRKVWDISRGRYWCLRNTGVGTRYISGIFHTPPPARSVEVHEIHLPDTQETSLINCAIRLADSDRQCPYKPLHSPAAFLLHR